LRPRRRVALPAGAALRVLVPSHPGNRFRGAMTAGPLWFPGHAQGHEAG
jgi:hypothetical protein